MGNNIFYVSNEVVDVCQFVVDSCKALHGLTKFSDLKFWFLHLGKVTDLDRYEFSQEFLVKLFEPHLGSDIPSVICLHLSGYPDENIAAEMCHNVLSTCEGGVAIVIDLENDTGNMVNISDRLGKLLGGSDKFVFVSKTAPISTSSHRLRSVLVT